MPFDKYRYIVVEGPIGAGKTTLARRLATRLDARLLLEQPELNPFLTRFYQDMPRYALATQLSFLFQRVQQLENLAQEELCHGVTIADFLFDKDALFAELTLPADELALYRTIHSHVRLHPPSPDLVIYLQAHPEKLTHQIEERGHDYELMIPDGYLKRLTDRYSQFFYDYNDAPLLIVNADNLNLVDNDEDFALLLARIADMQGAREYFNRT